MAGGGDGRDQFRKKSYAVILAMQGVPFAVCAALGPVAAAWIFDRSGSQLVAFWLSAGIFLLAAGLVIASPHPPLKRG